MGASVIAYRTSAVASIGTTWTAFASDGSWDLVVPAAAGDVIELGTSVMWTSVAVYAYMDAATIVSGSPVSWVSTGTGSHTDGVASWFQENVSSFVGAGGSMLYTVQSGDVSSGQVTFRLYGKTSSSTRTLQLGAPAMLWGSVCDNAPSVSGLSGTLSSTSFVALTGTNTVTAAAGDVLAVTMDGRFGAAAGVVSLDAATMVSGSPVGYFSSGTTTQGAGGVGAWRCNLADSEPVTGTAQYVVQSGDVVSGQVTVQVYGKVSSGSRALDSGSLFILRKV